MFEFIVIFKFTIITIFFSFLFCCLAFNFNSFFFFKKTIEKNSAYECGFESFSLNPIIKNFEIEFLVVALLFLIFDLEIIFLIPWILFYAELGFIGFLFVFFFLLILFIGFFIEYFRGLLHWNLAKVREM